MYKADCGIKTKKRGWQILMMKTFQITISTTCNDRLLHQAYRLKNFKKETMSIEKQIMRVIDLTS